MRRRAPLLQAILVKVCRYLNKERYSLLFNHLLMNGDGSSVTICNSFLTNQVGIRDNLDTEKRQNWFTIHAGKRDFCGVCAGPGDQASVGDLAAANNRGEAEATDEEQCGRDPTAGCIELTVPLFLF